MTGRLEILQGVFFALLAIVCVSGMLSLPDLPTPFVVVGAIVAIVDIWLAILEIRAGLRIRKERK